MATKRPLSLLFAIALIFACVACACAATKPKPKPKPPAKPPVSGIQPALPMPGQWADLNKPYYLGEGKQIVFTLTNAAFSCDRLYFSDDIVTASGEEKLLVLKFTLQNPKKDVQSVNWATVRFTVVDSEDNNREGTDYVGQALNKQKLDMSLKPAQKVECYTCVKIPNDCSAPKLIVRPYDEFAVLRYDLHGKVTPLQPPFMDPADTTGQTALAVVPGEKGKLYPGTNFDFGFDEIKFVGGTYADTEPEEGYGWAILAVTIKNMAKEKMYMNWATLTPTLKGKSGVISFGDGGVFANADGEAGAESEMEPGDSVGVQYCFPVKNGAVLNSFGLQEGDDGRRYQWDLGGVRAEF